MTRKLEPEPLPPGAWRLDPFTRVLRYVYDDPEATVPDAFDEPLEPVDRGPTGRPRKPIDHGTYNGARAHYRRKEELCDSCKEADRRHHQDRNARLRKQGGPKFTCECGGYKYRTSERCNACAVSYRWSRENKKEAA